MQTIDDEAFYFFITAFSRPNMKSSRLSLLTESSQVQIIYSSVSIQKVNENCFRISSKERALWNQDLDSLKQRP